MAYIYLRDLDDAVHSSGLKVVLIDGWENRGRPSSTGGFTPIKGISVHHTATSKATTDKAAVSLLVNGREGLPGPLSQLGLGRDGTVYVIAAGRANHGGETKQISPFTRGDLNYQSIGIEAYNSGYEGWSKKQLKAYHTLCAALCDWYNLPRSAVRAHAETSVTGKWDPGVNGKVIDMTKFRKEVNAVVLPGADPHRDYGKMDPRSYYRGSKNDSVVWYKKKLAARLKELKISHKMNVSARYYGKGTIEATKLFQEAQDWTGTDADGFPGKETLRRVVIPVAEATHRTFVHTHVTLQAIMSPKLVDKTVRAIITSGNYQPEVVTGNGCSPKHAAVLTKIAKEFGYSADVRRDGSDSWVLVRNGLSSKPILISFTRVIPPSSSRKKSPTKYSRRGVLRVELTIRDKKVSVYTVHGLTLANSQNQSIKAGATFSHLKANRRLFKKMDTMMKADKKAGIASFFGADFNMKLNSKRGKSPIYGTDLVINGGLNTRLTVASGKISSVRTLTCESVTHETYKGLAHRVVKTSWKLKF